MIRFTTAELNTQSIVRLSRLEISHPNMLNIGPIYCHRLVSDSLHSQHLAREGEEGFMPVLSIIQTYGSVIIRNRRKNDDCIFTTAQSQT